MVKSFLLVTKNCTDVETPCSVFYASVFKALPLDLKGT